MNDDLNKNDKILIEECKIIQDIIKRMAENSFKIKAWTITLVVATLLIKSNINNAYISLIPLLTFWFLDSYYLQQEKVFREMYKDKIKNKATNESTMLEINPNKFKTIVPGIFSIMLWNKSTTPLYLTILILLVLLFFREQLSNLLSCIEYCRRENF